MQDLTTGSLARHLLKTTSFMLVGMVFQTLYVLVDLYWVSHLGTEAVAAVGLSGNLMFAVLAVTQMLGVGTTTLISHAAGRKDRARALAVFNQSLVLGAVMGLLFLAVALATIRVYTRTLAADAPTEALAAEYLRWFIPAMALQFGMVAMGSSLRGTGLFKPSMVVQMVTVILNILFAPFLIFGWGTGVALGVAGAAIASLAAIAIGTAWLALYFRPAGSFLKFVRADWKPNVGLWRELLKVGLPAGAEFALMAAYLFLVYFVTRPFGAAAQAGFGIGGRVIQACFLPVVALGFGVAPVAGQNFGARHASRVRDTFKAAAAMAGGAMLVAAVVLHAAPAWFIRLFSTDPGVVATGSEYVSIIAWTFVPSGITFVSSSMFQAMGNTLPSLFTSFTRIVAVAIPVLLLAQRPDFALRWVWYLSVVSVLLQMTMNLLLLRREFRVRLNWSVG
jgi:putative MATE family efflux protein